MPNILVYIDARDGVPTPPTLFAVSEARRIARLAGASTFAALVTRPLSTSELERVAGPVGEAGADKLLLCEAADFGGPPDDATHGRALDAAVARVPPMFVLFPAGGTGPALGPPLAARLGGAFAPWCDFVTSDADVPAPPGTGRVQLAHFRPDGESFRRLDPVELERPIVATLGAGRRPAVTGTLRDLEVEVVPMPARGDRAMALEQDRMTNPHAGLELSSILVLIGNSDGGGGDRGAPSRPILKMSDLAAAGTWPVGIAIARAGDVPPGVLANCCPDVLLRIGPSATRVARSPRTRIVLATIPDASSASTSASTSPSASSRETGAAPVPVDNDVDVLWQLSSAAHLTAETITALLCAMGEPA